MRFDFDFRLYRCCGGRDRGLFCVLGLPRLGKPVWWLVPGIASLVVFAWLLTLVELNAAGRAYAAYGGIYIAASLVWLWAVENVRPDRWDVIGAAVCLVGAGHHPVRPALRNVMRFSRCCATTSTMP